LKQTDVEPTDVELEPASREPRRLGISVMIVVQLLTAEPDGDRRDIATLVLHLVVAIAECVADAVYDSGGPERNPQHLHAPHDRSDEEPEQIDVDREHDDDAEPVETAQDVPLDPIVGGAFAVFLEHPRLANGASIVERPLEHDVAKSLEEGTMGVA